jgi:hypothetical protein
MDALRRDAAILRELLIAGPLLTIPLLLFAFLAFLLGAQAEKNPVEAFLLCMLFSQVCFVARAASRVATYCESSGRLGMPFHAAAMRRAQCIVISLFTLVPGAFALWIGADFHIVIIFLGGITLAIYLAEALIWVVFAAFALKGLAATGVDPIPFLFGTFGSVVILSVSAWGIARWLRLPQRLESAAGAASSALSDIAHEAEDGELDMANDVFEDYLGDVLAPPEPESISPRRLWIGLSYDPRGNWRANAIGACIAIALILICHFWKHGIWDVRVYLMASGVFALYVFGRFQQMHEAWLRTPGEQSLLVLSPRWPPRARMKALLLRSVWGGIPALFAGWLLFSGVTLATGWIGWREVLLALLGLAAVLVSSLGIFLSYFAHRALRATSRLQMFYLLIALVGTATFLISVANGSRSGALIGAALVLAPFAVAALAFTLRPALFPVQTVTRK